MGDRRRTRRLGRARRARLRRILQLPPEFRARNVEPLPAAWLRDERHATPDVTIAPAVVRAEDQLPAVTRFDIPPGPLAMVIAAFEKVTGYTVTLADPALGEIASPGVSGVTTVDQALAQILTGTESARAKRACAS